MGIFSKKPQEETQAKSDKQSIFTKETLGVVLVLFATLCLVCLITRDAVFSVPGELVNSFLFGCFGYFAYLVMFLTIGIGITLITGKKFEFDGKIKIYATLSIILLANLLHVVTLNSFSGNYGEYLSTSYLMASEGGILTCSGGGIVTALVAYVFPLILGNTGSYVVLSILLAVCVTLTVRAIVRVRAEQSSNNKTELRTSFVKNENTNATMPTVNVDGVMEYPVDVDFPAESTGVQKLFVVNAGKDDFKASPKAKDGDPVISLNVGYTKGGLSVASSSSSYSQGYADDIQSKIDYIKTPAPINVESVSNTGNVNQGGYYQTTPQTNVSDYIPQNQTVYNEPQENVAPHVNNIPLFQHDDVQDKDDAESHANRYGRLADFDATQISNTYSQVEEPTEVERPTVSNLFGNQDNESQNPFDFDQIRHVEEPEQDDLEQADTFTDYANEQPAVQEDVVENTFDTPSQSTVGRERVRNIFFERAPEPEEETEEKPIELQRPAYTSRVEADDNLSSVRRRGFTVEPEPTPPPVEEPKPQKVEAPINREYFRPPFDLLQDYQVGNDTQTENHEENMEIIKQTLAEFHIDVEPQTFVQGPSITRYEIKMPAGVSVKRVLTFDEDLRMRLSSKEGVRIEAPIPGKNLVGIEVPNKVPQTVGLKEVMELAAQNGPSKPGSLMFALGKDIVGNAITDNLAKGPHYLVAGATGSGKSVCLNTMIVSLIMRYSPEELKLFLVDPKGVEFATYEHLPHLMIDEIITSPPKAIEMLKWAYTEMERRFLVFRECNAGIVNIDDYNANIASNTIAKMPRIVIIIDELADLMQTCKKDLEPRICAIAQKARSAGIHLVLATQRPSVDVITGLIKANLPSRIAFKVMNIPDSQTILSESGAEKLLGNGDMLYKNSQMPGCARYQGAYIHMREVNNVVNYIKEHNKAYFDDELKDFLEKAVNPQPAPSTSSEGASVGGGDSEYSDIFIRALWFAVNSGTISISSMQRRFGMGFSKAGGIMDKMDRMGFVSPNEGGRARRVLLTREECEEKFGPPPPDEYR